jgi:hypothetical protein
MEKGPVYLVQRTEMKCGLVQWEWIWKRVLNVVDEVAKGRRRSVGEGVVAEEERPEVRQVVKGVTGATLGERRGRTGRCGDEG